MAVKRSTASRRAQDNNMAREVESPSAEPAPTAIVGPPRDEVWRAYCKLAVNICRSNKKDEFEQALRAGSLPQITEPPLMQAAFHLTGRMAAAGVHRWDWLPSPSEADLADPAGWAAQRLAARRAEQDEVERVRHLNQKVARALGQSPAGGSGTPVYAQRLKRPLAEAGDSLERVMTQHQAEHGEFDHRWLDPHSPRFIAGITNKEVIMMASEISGVRSRRPFEENVKIVTDWLRTRKTEEPTQPQPDQAM